VLFRSSGLAAIGVPVVAHPQQRVDLVQEAAARRAESMKERARGSAALQRPSRERQLLGDRVADACGFL
jgi:hypothetical protein